MSVAVTIHPVFSNTRFYSVFLLAYVLEPMQLYLSCRGADLSSREEDRRRHPPLLMSMVLSVCWDKVVARMRSIEGERGRLWGTAVHRTMEMEWMCWDRVVVLMHCLVLRR
jgi:hypothetical protein